MDVYPWRVGTWFGVVLLPLFLAGDVWLLASDSLVRWRAAIEVVALFVFGKATAAFVRQLREPRPAVRLDRNGLSSAAGFVPWSSVERIELRWRLRGRALVQKLELRLAPGAPDPEPVAREWAARWVYGAPELHAGRLELPLWGWRRRVVEDLRRWYSGPIEA